MAEVAFEFVKYQACGNDFILKDERRGITISEKERFKFARVFCDRHFGIGADGVLFIESSNRADARMRVFDRENREAMMCGNGIRCAADYLCNELKRDTLTIDTRNSLKRAARTGIDQYRINMGKLRYSMQNLKNFLKVSSRMMNNY